MKKILLSFTIALLLFTACDDFPSDVVDTENPNYKLTTVSAPAEFIFTENDSTFRASLTFSNSGTISKVWFNVLTSDAASIIKQKVSMGQTSSGENEVTYSGSTVMGSGIPSGEYVIDFYVEDNVSAGDEKVQQVASHNFQFFSGQLNSAPVISNLVAPDTVEVQDPRSLIELHITVADSNGLLDIDEAYFNVFGPGQSTGNKVSMFDDGADANGDENAGDGIFSRIIEVTPTNTKGEYRFEFEAVDKVGEVSNKIIHTLTVK